MRKTKTVYTFDANGLFVGTDIAFESCNLNGVYIIPSNSTEQEVPLFDSKTEQVIFDGKTWEVKQIPTEENTSKPDFDSNTHQVIWSENSWILVELPTQENTPKPEYDENVYTCNWDVDHWILNIIPTWDIIRTQRDQFLKDSDWSVMPDSNPKPSKEAWLTYRQALRDVPQNFSTPEEVVWPEKPL